MVFRRPFVHRSLTLVLLLTAVAGVELLAPPLAAPGVTACTGYTDKRATLNGCVSSWGYTCYACDHTNQNGTQRCYEYPNPDDGKFCDPPIDHRDIPGDIW